MKIKILGAHNLESQDSRCVSLLIDDIIALDAGAITSGMSFTEQKQLKAVLLSHHHYDHIRDIPALAINFSAFKNTINIYCTQSVCDIITNNLLDGKLYPNFLERPPEKPAVSINILEPNKPVQVADYNVLAVPVNHAVPTVGLQLTSPDGKNLFYTSDTGPGLDNCWQYVNPDLLVAEVTALNIQHEFALKSGHLTPAMLQEELSGFQKQKGYLPRIVLVHMNPLDEEKIKKEINAVEKSLNINIQLGYEEMQLEL
jgi:ribonuclease BN (tRNA processing enzyme)